MPKALRIVFMGTPEFALESLKAVNESRHSVVGVITAPDKPAGRGKKLEAPPVKKYAEAAGIYPILQPSNLKDPFFIEQLTALHADLQVVVAFRMLPEAVWTLPPKGTINLHASLLPDYRGAAPINWAIINGEKETGITTFFIDKEIDTGHIIFQERISITPAMNAGELHDILMQNGARLIVKTIDAIAADEFEATPQTHRLQDKKIHPAPKIFKEHCRINWNDEGKRINDLIRGLSPYPTAWTELSQNDIRITLKIYRSSFGPAHHSYPCGKILTDRKTCLRIAVSDGFIYIESLQQAGKKRMEVQEFLNGFTSIDSCKLLI